MKDSSTTPLRAQVSKDLEQIIQRMIRLSYGGDMQAAKALFEIMSGKYEEAISETSSPVVLTDEQALKITALAQPSHGDR